MVVEVATDVPCDSLAALQHLVTAAGIDEVHAPDRHLVRTALGIAPGRLRPAAELGR